MDFRIVQPCRKLSDKTRFSFRTRKQHTMVSLDKLSVLVVEANQGMRAQLRTMLDGFQITGVQFAASAGAAIRKLREQRYDVILCEHNLGEGQDGQHLLEDLRSKKIIPLDTLFIMISSERNYERVVGAAELAPNDYILKPLTPGTLQERLERAVAKREIFRRAHRMIEAGDLQSAIDHCVAAEPDHPAHKVDFMRLRAELHAEQGQSAQSEAIYRRILEIKPAPWARLGLARMLFAQRRLDEAQALLEALVSESGYYLDAYDWLARVRAEASHAQEARDVMASAVKLSPHRLGRLREFGDLSIKAGDYQGAEQALQEVVRKGKFSEFRDPEDHVRLLKAQLMQHRFAEAEATIQDLDKTMGGSSGAPICSALARGLLHQCTGDRDSARKDLAQAVKSARDNPELPLSLKQELVKACLDNQMESETGELVGDILRHADDESTIESTRSLLRERGRLDLSERVEERLHTEVKGYIANGAQKAQAGDFDGAVSEMMTAVRRMPGNPHVLFNAALALLRHIEHNGWNERFAAQARTLITRTRKLDPNNPRLEAITQFMQNLVRKYGIRANATLPSAHSARSPFPG